MPTATAPKIDAKALTSELMEAHAQQLPESRLWAMVQSAATFYRYSRRNCQLIAAQGYGYSPAVAAYPEWRKRGRQVRKGEKAIYILAPIMVKDRVHATVDPITGEVQPLMKQLFKAVPIFAYEQTDEAEGYEGEPWQPDQHNHSDDANRAAIIALEQLAADRGAPVSWQVRGDNNANARGVYRPDRRQIIIFHHEDSAANLAVLAHEVAHLIHLPTSEEARKVNPQFAECVAEIASYGITQALGVADAGQAAAYTAYCKLAQILESKHCDQLHADIAEATRIMAAAIFTQEATDATNA